MLNPVHHGRMATARSPERMIIKSVLLAAVAAVSAVMAQPPQQRDTTVPGPDPDVELASQSTAAVPPVVARRGYANPWAAIAYAKQQLGKPYRWGDTGHPGFDCSGLVMKAWQAGGVYLPRTTYQMARVGTRLGRWQLQPGDLVFSNNFGHVQLYLGDGRIIEAARPGTVVHIGWLPYANRVNAYMRVRA